MELQARYAELRNLGLGIASVTYDPPALIKKFADERKIEFPILSDADHAIVQRYGILNRQYAPGDRNYGIPHPGTFILNRDRRVLARYFEEEYQYRNTAASIALKIGRPVPGMSTPSRHATPDLDLAVFVSDQTVAPGHRFSVVLDITPKPGMHVVAPGQHRYRAVALRLDVNDTLRTYRVSYPQGTDFLLAPKNERLPAYAQPFRLVQDLAIVVNDETRQRAQKAGATVTLKGVFEYQACTETACSVPREVPLSWTVGLKPLG
ncbi:MAG: redoxin domain-containing protein [Acidobacteria bacterium]|nr:redoxin domain-containing protein [Acidobacteriota bacterium]